MYETADYMIGIGPNKSDETVYQVINKFTEVVEYEDYMLPRAIDTMLVIQERLDEAKEADRKAFLDPPLTLITGGNDDEGTGGLHPFR